MNEPEQVMYVPPSYNPGQELDLIVEEGPLEGSYSTTVRAVEDGTLVLPVPRVHGLYLPVPVDQAVHLKYYNRGASFEGESRVENREELEGTPLLSVTAPGEVKRIQRRDFLRVPCSLDVEVLVLETPGDEEVHGTFDVEMVDISAGGGQLVSPRSLPVFTDIQLTFTLPSAGRRMEDLFGRILREWEAEERSLYNWAVEFTGLTENQRNDIVRYVYRRQMELNS